MHGWRRCAECGRDFPANTPHARYCREVCRNNAASRRLYARRVERGWKKGPGATGWIRQVAA